MLTDTSIRAIKPTLKPVKRSDGGGLFLQVNPNGSKWWRLAYRYGGKQKLLSMGTYPDTSLKQARVRRDEARRLLAAGVDPSEHRKLTVGMDASRDSNTFEAVALEWFSKFKGRWSLGYADEIISRLKRGVFPWMGARPINEISSMDLLAVLQRIEGGGRQHPASLTKRDCGRIFKFAIATGRATIDPTTALRGALIPTQGKHLASITDPNEIGALLRTIDGYAGSFVSRCALRLAPYLFVRTNELRRMEWAELNLDGAEWAIPKEKMKMKVKHIVPLSTQSVEILREIEPLTGAGRYVFPSAWVKSNPMSGNTLLAALRRMGYDSSEMTIHGFRSMASTILNEQGFNKDWIERQLAHSEKDDVRASYNYAEHLPERRKMMQHWADYLDQLAGRNVVPLKSAMV